ncbi:MAG: hypothetical protein ACYDEV_11850, partial [Acidiferrobacter sp.]
MRHFIGVAGSEPAGPFGMGMAPTTARLITSPRFSLGVPPRFPLGVVPRGLRTVRRAVHLPAVASAADQCLCPTALAQKE